MKPITFPQVTNLVAKDQPQYGTLPSYVGELYDKAHGIICCFELDQEDLDQINKHKKLWYRGLTFGQPLQPFNIFTMEDYFQDEERELMRADVNTKVINGREIKYLDKIIHNTTGIKFSFWDRLKILFGYPIQMNAEIYTTHGHCNVVAGETNVFVPDWFKNAKGFMQRTGSLRTEGIVLKK